MLVGGVCESDNYDKSIKIFLNRKYRSAQDMVDINSVFCDMLYVRQNALKSYEKRAKIAIAIPKKSAYNGVRMSI